MSEHHHAGIHTPNTLVPGTADTGASFTAIVSTQAPDGLSGLTEGRIVHYVLPDGRSAGQHRPAIVVRDWKQTNGLVQLQVFTDARNDYDHGQDGYNGIMWRTSVHYSETKEPGTWHWIEKA